MVHTCSVIFFDEIIDDNTICKLKKKTNVNFTICFHLKAVLIFKTPQYMDTNIAQPIKVSMELRRKKDSSCVSAPFPFTYKPQKYGSYYYHLT